MAVEVGVRESEAVEDGLCLIRLVAMVFVLRKRQAGLPENGVFGEMDVLGQVGDSISRGNRDCAGVLVFLTKDHAEERGLAVAVPAHESHALARVYRKADAVEQHLLAERFFDIRGLEHLCALLRGAK